MVLKNGTSSVLKFCHKSLLTLHNKYNPHHHSGDSCRNQVSYDHAFHAWKPRVQIMLVQPVICHASITISSRGGNVGPGWDIT